MLLDLHGLGVLVLVDQGVRDLGYHAYGAASNDANNADVPDVPDTVGEKRQSNATCTICLLAGLPSIRSSSRMRAVPKTLSHQSNEVDP